MKSVKTAHYIGGVNVKDISKAELISEIAVAELDVAQLKDLTTESTAITAEIERVEQFIKAVVVHLDSK